MLRNALKPKNRLADTAYNASMRGDPPIDVVPDGQMPKKPQYGAETSVQQNVQQDLSGMLGSIQAQRAENPVYMPFEPGTQTLDARRLAQTAAAAQQRIGLSRDQLQQSQEQDRLRNQYDIWEATGQAPEGIPGIEAGAELFTPEPKPTAAEQRREAEADATEAIDAAIQKGLSKQEIEKNINAQYADLVRQGVDPQSLITYLSQKELTGSFTD